MKDVPTGIKVLLALAVLMIAGAATAVAGLPITGDRFSTFCEPSHTARDDPIVLPGMPGMSHRHQFFGASGTDAFSKPADLRGGPTSCRQESDTAAYWVPTLRINGRTVKPQNAQIYYDAGNKDRELVQAFPAGLRMVAGSADATERQPVSKVTWYCRTAPTGNNGSNGNPADLAVFAIAHRNVATPHPHCGQPGANLSTLVRFPDCWDGRHLDSPNHRRHVRYAVAELDPASGRETKRTSCPQSHPVPIPRIVMTVHYPTVGHANRRKIELSSGGIFSLHADFMNSWDQGMLERLVRRCINLGIDCRAR